MLTIVTIIFIVLQVLIVNWMYNHYDDSLEPVNIKIQGIAALIFFNVSIHHGNNCMEARMAVLKIIAITALVSLVMWTNHWVIEETEVDE